MKRLLACFSLLSLTGALGAACSPSGDDGALCARVSACLGDTGSKFGPSCEIATAYDHLDASILGTEDKVASAAIACVKAASDCAGAKACVSATSAQAAACKGGTTSRCSGDVLVRCDDVQQGTPQIEDCAAAGLSCFQDDSGAGCGSAACKAGTTMPTCDGDNVVACGPGGALVAKSCRLDTETSCSGDGMTVTCTSHVAETCAVVSGAPTCVGSGDACKDDTWKPKCDGTTVVTCTGGKVARFDCTTFDAQATCKDEGNGLVDCAGAGKECTDSTPDTCKDGVITYCMWGTKATLDCKSVGLKGCAMNDAMGAACTP